MDPSILNSRKRRPTHPGEILREEILPEIGMSQGVLAQALGVSRQTVNELVKEKRSMSMDMAYRLGRLFDMDATVWIRMQEAVDAWDTLQQNAEEYRKIKPLKRKMA